MKETRDANAEQNLASLGFLGLTALLIIVFLSYRGADAGRLPLYLSGFFTGDFFSLNGFGESLLGLLIAFLILAAWFGLGRFFTGFFETDESFGSLNLAQNCAFGAALWSLIWFFAGLFKAYNAVTAGTALVAGLALAIYFAAKDVRSLKNSEAEKTSVLGKSAFLLILLALGLALISALAPPTAKDTLLYHMALPKAFIAQDNHAIVEGNIASFLALGAEMQNVWAMLLGNIFSQRIGEAAVGAVVFAFAPLLLLAIYGWARELEIKKDLAVIAALLVAAIPTFYHVAANVYVDLALALYVTLAIRAVGRWWSDLQAKWLVYMSLALGAALSIKLTTLFVIAAIALIVLLRARTAQNEEAAEKSNAISIALKGLAALVFAGVIASPWYLRTWAASGSPLFPFYLNIWKGSATGWDADRSALFQAVNSNYGGANKNLFDYLFAPVKISLFAQPEIPQFYDGVLGVGLLLGLILIIWSWRQFDLPTEIKIAAAVGGIFFLFWLFSSQQLRYLLPIAPSLAVASVVAAQRLATTDVFRKTIYVSFLAASVSSLLVSFAWFAEQNPPRVVFGGESREDYLTRRLDYYGYYKIVNRDLPPDAKVWLINMRRDTYHLERAYFSDYLSEDWTLKKLVEQSRGISELRQKARALGVTHVLTRHDFLLDYKQSVIVDDRRDKAENDRKLKMTENFVLDQSNAIASDKKFSLVKLP